MFCRHAKDSWSLRQTFATSFNLLMILRHTQKSPSIYYYYYYYYSCLLRLQPWHSKLYPHQLLSYLKNIYIQLHGYLKNSFSNPIVRYGTKQLHFGRHRSWSHESAGRRPPSELAPWQWFSKKTTEAFLTIACELYLTIFERIAES